GNVSNFLTSLAKGNTALSVSLTAFMSVAAIILTPLNFKLWASLYSPTSALLREIQLDVGEMFSTVVLIIGLPLLLGIFTRQKFSQVADRVSKILKPLSILIFAAFVVVAFAGNFDLFLKYIGVIFLWVLAHNFTALSAGFLTGKIGKLPLADVKTL